jgi:hypothetical protein
VLLCAVRKGDIIDGGALLCETVVHLTMLPSQEQDAEPAREAAAEMKVEDADS